MNDDQQGLVSLPHVEIRGRLLELRQRHQDLDAAISALEQTPETDQLRIMRLKKEKLVLRDQIARLEASMKPDIIA